MMKKIFFLFLMILPVFFMSALIDSSVSFSEWYDICFKDLPEYDRLPSSILEYVPILSLDELTRVVAGMLEETAEQLYDSDLWIEGSFPDIDEKFPPFMQKVVVEPGTSLYIQGDIHGSLHSLLRNLNQLKGKNFLKDDFSLNNINLFFLGDYGDRGHYSVEVLYTLARLKEKNPDKVFLVKGNHEKMEMAQQWGFVQEIKAKYGEPAEEIFTNDLSRFFDFLPLGIFVGSGTPEETNYLLLCHGTPEWGYAPHDLLTFNNHEVGIYFARDLYDIYNTDMFKNDIFNAQLEKIDWESRDKLKEAYRQKSESLLKDYQFNWGDLDDKIVFDEWRGSVVVTPLLVNELLNAYSVPEKNDYVRLLFRGHQHARLGNGIFVSSPLELFLHCEFSGVERPLRKGIIYTLFSAPEVRNKKDEKGYDSFVLVKTAPLFNEWKITPYQFKVPAVSQFFKVSPLIESPAYHVSERDGKKHISFEINGKKRERPEDKAFEGEPRDVKHMKLSEIGEQDA